MTKILLTSFMTVSELPVFIKKCSHLQGCMLHFLIVSLILFHRVIRIHNDTSYIWEKPVKMFWIVWSNWQVTVHKGSYWCYYPSKEKFTCNFDNIQPNLFYILQYILLFRSLFRQLVVTKAKLGQSIELDMQKFTVSLF